MKHAVLRLTDHWLMTFLKTFKGEEAITYRITANALPEDTRPVRCFYDYQGHFCLLLESEQFRNVKDGEQYPYLDEPTLQVEKK